VTLAAYLLPAAIGDASLAGLPPETGVYACLFAGLFFWLFCSSKHTVVTVTSAMSLLIGSSLGDLTGGNPSRHAALAGLTALMTGLLALTAWAFKAGNLTAFISESVMAGFKTGVAFHLASTQLPKLFGFKGAPGDFWERSHSFLSHLPETHLPSLVLGLGALILLLAGKFLLPARPVSLFVVIAGIAAVPLFGLTGIGVKTLGDVPRGIPLPSLPDFRASDLNDLLPLALGCFLLGAVETTAIGRMFGRKHQYRVDSNQEFLALGLSNLAAGLGRGFPVSGGMSQSLVNETAGARTPASGLVATLILVVVALFLTGLLRNLPQPVLAAIVLRRASRPRTTELGRVPGTTYFADLVRHPDNERIPDVFVFRTEAALMYFNVDYVRERLQEGLEARGPGVRLVVLFMGTVPAVDLAGLEFLEELQQGLRRGIALRLAETRGQVREVLLRGGFEKRGAPVIPNQPVATVIDQWRS
jgi:MFS superfamily sulfate permease-like transporter